MKAGDSDIEEVATLLRRLYRYGRRENVWQADDDVKVEITGILRYDQPLEKQLNLDVLREILEYFDMGHGLC